MTDRELMQQALEALELAYAGIDAITVHGKAIAALRERLAQSATDYWQEEARRYAQNADYWRSEAERLAQPEQEPVLYVDPNLDRVCTDKKLAAKYGLYIPLYAKPQSAAKGDNL